MTWPSWASRQHVFFPHRGRRRPFLEGEALRERIQFQVEYYLSRDNLARDAYLVSQMDKVEPRSREFFSVRSHAPLQDSFVDIEVLASFKKLKLLGGDSAAIAAALASSTVVELDASRTKVKPRTKPLRNTIILREIASSTDPALVVALFAPGAGAPQLAPPQVRQVRAEVGDNWFAVFDDEPAALHALNWLRTVTFNGEPVRARMKTDSSALRSYYQPQPAVGAGRAPTEFMVAAPYWDPMQQQQQQQVFTQALQPSAPQQQHQQQYRNIGGGFKNNGTGKYDRGYKGKTDAPRGGGGGGKKATNLAGGAAAAPATATAKKTPAPAPRPTPEPELNLAQFPPLAPKPLIPASGYGSRPVVQHTYGVG